MRVCMHGAVGVGSHANIWRGLYSSVRGLRPFRQKKAFLYRLVECVCEGTLAVHKHVRVCLKWSVSEQMQTQTHVYTDTGQFYVTVFYI